MSKCIEDMTREELELEILSNDDGLYESFNEQKFLKRKYTMEDLLKITRQWIMEGNEAA